MCLVGFQIHPSITIFQDYFRSSFNEEPVLYLFAFSFHYNRHHLSLGAKREFNFHLMIVSLFLVANFHFVEIFKEGDLS